MALIILPRRDNYTNFIESDFIPKHGELTVCYEENGRNKRLKKKREKLQEEYSWTSTWQQYKTIITIECAVTDSIDEKEKDRLINHLRSTWEDDGIKVIVKNCG